MAYVITINRPDVVAAIEDAAKKLTGGNKTEAVALAMRGLLAQNARSGSLFNAHPGAARFTDDADPFAPALSDVPEAETGYEVAR